jgi:hypothetical protein
VPAKQTVTLDANANAIAATAGLFINIGNKFLLIFIFLSQLLYGYTRRTAIRQKSGYRLPEGARNLLFQLTKTRLDHAIPDRPPVLPFSLMAVTPSDESFSFINDAQS